MVQSANRPAYTGVIVGQPSKVLTKRGAQGQTMEYVLIDVKLTSGAGTGTVVAGTRTIVNSKGIDKPIPDVGDEVTVYHSVVPSTTEGEKFAHFFDIQVAGHNGAGNNDLTAIFGL